jgi:acyl carrier protein
MQDQILIGQVREIMADSFGLDQSDLPEVPSQANLARWTSLLHMVLVVSLEERFSITFTMEEISSMTSLDRIVDMLQKRQALGLPV